MKIEYEILIRPNPSPWRRLAIHSIAKATKGQITTEYSGISRWLIIIGWTETTQSAVDLHQSKNKPVIFLDMGQLTRDRTEYKISVNRLYPSSQLHLAGTTDRFTRHNIQLTDNSYDPHGHILLVGASDNATSTYKYKIHEWEHQQIKSIKRVFGNRDIVYRPKPVCPSQIEGTIDGSPGNIYKWLDGCALSVVLNSWVAVESAICGVPCVAYNGIGKKIFNHPISADVPMLTKEQRLQFLHQVSWFEWNCSESVQMIEFAKHVHTKMVEEDLVIRR